MITQQNLNSVVIQTRVSYKGEKPTSVVILSALVGQKLEQTHKIDPGSPATEDDKAHARFALADSETLRRLVCFGPAGRHEKYRRLLDYNRRMLDRVK